MHRRPQRGQAIVLIAIMLAVVVGMAALAIDGSRAYALRRDLQAAVDAAALAAGDNLQQTGSYASAEQAAIAIFAANLRLYGSASCSPAYAAPGASPLTLTCTYPDGTTLTQVISALGPQGSQFRVTATRPLQLQFAKILTNGASPTLAGAAAGGVNNLLYTPTVAALDQAGCGGAGGSAISLSGNGTLSVFGDLVASGRITVSSSAMNVAGDIYARCQPSVSGAVNSCYPSGATTPCAYPDVAGAVRSGYRFIDPNYAPPTGIGGAVGAPSASGGPVNLVAGIIAGVPGFSGGHCWFLSGGVYEWQAGYMNTADFVSNELKPPDEPETTDNTERSSNQFWDTNSVGCSGSVQLNTTGGPRGIAVGTWSFVLTSTRSDTYGGRAYPRESAPSMCYQQHVNNSGQNIQVTVSNVPGATSYNIYAAPPGNGCNGPFGLAEVLPVSVTVSNTNTNPCPKFNGNGCSLGHESVTLDTNDLGASFTPNVNAAPGVIGAYPPNGETSPLNGSLPNQNPARGPGSSGDRANENNCETVGGVYATCPAAVTPGAVEFYMPSGACTSSSNGGDTFIFSGYQYDWLVVYEPGRGNPPANNCPGLIGAAGNSAYVGLVYMPASAVVIPSAYGFEDGSGGLIANTLTFNGSMPTINLNAGFAPVPPATKLTG
jgi:Flp pilus assembly protein TadG